MAAGSIEKITVVLQAMTSGFAKGLGRAQTQLKSVGKNMQEFGAVMAMPMKNFKEINNNMKATQAVGGKVAKRFRMMTHGMRGFRMEALDVMYFGMMMQRMFMNLLQPVMEAFGVFDLFRIMLLTLFLPIMEAIFPFLLALMEWFMNLPGPVKKAIGIFVILGLMFGTIIMILGQFALGIGSLILMFGTSFGVIIGIVGNFILVFAGIIFVVKGVYNVVKGKMEGIGQIIIGVGLILLLFIGWWALIPIAVGAAVYLVLKYWKSAQDGLKIVFAAIGDWIKKWLWEKPKEWIGNLWNYIKDIFGKIKSMLSGSVFGKAFKMVGGILGSFETGGIIPQTGPYLLHQGETVVPAGQPTGGGDGIIQENHFYGFTTDDLKRELDDRDRRLVDDIRRLVKT